MDRCRDAKFRVSTGLKEIPFFVRQAARKKIEKFAQENEFTQITEEVYEQAKQKFN